MARHGAIEAHHVGTVVAPGMGAAEVGMEGEVEDGTEDEVEEAAVTGGEVATMDRVEEHHGKLVGHHADDGSFITWYKRSTCMRNGVGQDLPERWTTVIALWPSNTSTSGNCCRGESTNHKAFRL